MTGVSIASSASPLQPPTRTLADIMESISSPIPLAYLLRSINEAIEAYVRWQPLTVQLSRITRPSESDGHPMWTLAGNDDDDGAAPLQITSPEEFCAHLKIPFTSAAVVDEVRRQLWHKMTRTNADAFACALMLIVYASLEKAGKKIVNGTEHYVTHMSVVDATVDECPCANVPLLRYVNNASGSVTSPIEPLHKNAIIREAIDPASGTLIRVATFKHRWLMCRLSPIDESDAATTTQFLHVDFTGAALDVFLNDDNDDDDDDKTTTPSTRSPHRLPRVVFFDDSSLTSQHADLGKYHALLNAKNSAAQVFDAEKLQRFVDATCRLDVALDTRTPQTGYLPSMVALSIEMLSTISTMARERAEAA